jgi:hypothetical protein
MSNDSKNIPLLVNIGKLVKDGLTFLSAFQMTLFVLIIRGVCGRYLPNSGSAEEKQIEVD